METSTKANSRKRAIWWGIACMLLLSCITIGAALICYTRELLHSTVCRNNLTEIGICLQSYHRQHGAFPPTYSCDDAENPLNSWRIVLVPHRLWYTFPPDYDFDDRWDSPNNARLLVDEHSKAWHTFNCPASNATKLAITNYVAIIGLDTMWQGCEPTEQAADDSDSDKILVIEVIDSDIQWMEPRDLTLDEALDTIQSKTGIRIGSRHREGIHYLTVGGEVRTLPHNIDRDSLRKLLVRDGPIQ